MWQFQESNFRANQTSRNISRDSAPTSQPSNPGIEEMPCLSQSNDCILAASGRRPMRPTPSVSTPIKSRGFKPMPLSARKCQPQLVHLPTQNHYMTYGHSAKNEINSLTDRRSQCSEGPISTHTHLNSQGHATAKDLTVDVGSPRAACAYSTGSAIDPDSSLLSPPLSPEMQPKPDFCYYPGRFDSQYDDDRRENRKYCSKDTGRYGFDASDPPARRSLYSSTDSSMGVGSFPLNKVSRYRESPSSDHEPLGVGPSTISARPKANTSRESGGVNSRASNKSTNSANWERRLCLSCGSKESPCWRPSWDAKLGQLCNSCGLRYRKTHIRCSSIECKYVPSKLELAELRSKARPTLKCPKCVTSRLIVG